jgi:tetratricopeptide (TPR) repeat protein
VANRLQSAAHWDAGKAADAYDALKDAFQEAYVTFTDTMKDYVSMSVAVLDGLSSRWTATHHPESTPTGTGSGSGSGSGSGGVAGQKGATQKGADAARTSRELAQYLQSMLEAHVAVDITALDAFMAEFRGSRSLTAALQRAMARAPPLKQQGQQGGGQQGGVGRAPDSVAYLLTLGPVPPGLGGPATTAATGSKGGGADGGEAWRAQQDSVAASAEAVAAHGRGSSSGGSVSQAWSLAADLMTQGRRGSKALPRGLSDKLMSASYWSMTWAADLALMHRNMSVPSAAAIAGMAREFLANAQTMAHSLGKYHAMHQLMATAAALLTDAGSYHTSFALFRDGLDNTERRVASPLYRFRLAELAFAVGNYPHAVAIFDEVAGVTRNLTVQYRRDYEWDKQKAAAAALAASGAPWRVPSWLIGQMVRAQQSELMQKRAAGRGSGPGQGGGPGAASDVDDQDLVVSGDRGMVERWQRDQETFSFPLAQPVWPLLQEALRARKRSAPSFQGAAKRKRRKQLLTTVSGGASSAAAAPGSSGGASGSSGSGGPDVGYLSPANWTRLVNAPLNRSIATVYQRGIADRVLATEFDPTILMKHTQSLSVSFLAAFQAMADPLRALGFFDAAEAVLNAGFDLFEPHHSAEHADLVQFLDGWIAVAEDRVSMTEGMGMFADSRLRDIILRASESRFNETYMMFRRSTTLAINGDPDGVAAKHIFRLVHRLWVETGRTGSATANNHTEVALLFGAAGWLFVQAGRCEQGASLLKASRSIYAQSFKISRDGFLAPLSYLRTISQSGFAMRCVGRPDLALRYFEKARDAGEQVLERGHPFVAEAAALYALQQADDKYRAAHANLCSSSPGPGPNGSPQPVPPTHGSARPDPGTDGEDVEDADEAATEEKEAEMESLSKEKARCSLRALRAAAMDSKVLRSFRLALDAFGAPHESAADKQDAAQNSQGSSEIPARSKEARFAASLFGLWDDAVANGSNASRWAHVQDNRAYRVLSATFATFNFLLNTTTRLSIADETALAVALTEHFPGFVDPHWTRPFSASAVSYRGNRQVQGLAAFVPGSILSKSAYNRRGLHGHSVIHSDEELRAVVDAALLTLSEAREALVILFNALQDLNAPEERVVAGHEKPVSKSCNGNAVRDAGLVYAKILASLRDLSAAISYAEVEENTKTKKLVYILDMAKNVTRGAAARLGLNLPNETLSGETGGQGTMRSSAPFLIPEKLDRYGNQRVLTDAEEYPSALQGLGRRPSLMETFFGGIAIDYAYAPLAPATISRIKHIAARLEKARRHQERLTKLRMQHKVVTVAAQDDSIDDDLLSGEDEPIIGAPVAIVSAQPSISAMRNASFVDEVTKELNLGQPHKKSGSGKLSAVNAGRLGRRLDQRRRLIADESKKKHKLRKDTPSLEILIGSSALFRGTLLPASASPLAEPQPADVRLQTRPASLSISPMSAAEPSGSFQQPQQSSRSPEDEDEDTDIFFASLMESSPGSFIVKETVEESLLRVIRILSRVNIKANPGGWRSSAAGKQQSSSPIPVASIAGVSATPIALEDPSHLAFVTLEVIDREYRHAHSPADLAGEWALDKEWQLHERL